MDITLVNEKFLKCNRFIARQYIVSYSEIEFESKIDCNKIKAEDIVKEIIKKYKKNFIKLDEIIHRKELHLFYRRADIHRAFVFLSGSDKVWIKEKGPANIINTPVLKIPVLVRDEKKLNPTDASYQKIFLETLNWDYEGSFQKECTDISFWFKDFLFTMTFAKAVKDRSILSQIEIEYDGHSNLSKCPSKDSVINLFDEVAENILPVIKQSDRFTVVEKSQWLKSLLH